MLTANEIRDSFKSFFESKGHHIVPSAPMVIKDDPTLMFTNAGMNQFKDIILGNHPAQWKRVADSQKCLRVSGKHNDLEEVGHDTYHHTMFEMLGNWSFGDYFKKEAISWAWEYLVDVLKLNPDNLYATVFEGSPEEGLGRDDEAAAYWEQFLPKDHIINGNKHDNFWEMGDTGPCGPCSEIHIDLRSEEEKAQVPGRDMVNHDHPQVIEIWNLVFMQFNRKADGSLEDLPARVIDTGMGFERLCMALQGKTSNYDTDVFQPMIQAIARMSGTPYGADAQKDVAMRVVADHIRTIAFSITDGQLPGNAKAGYVIRRILRRAVRYGYTFLGQKRAFMYKLLPVLIQEMGTAYPELGDQKDLIAKVMKEEEETFLRTLETGIRLLDKTMADAKAAGRTEISGKELQDILLEKYRVELEMACSSYVCALSSVADREEDLRRLTHALLDLDGILKRICGRQKKVYAKDTVIPAIQRCTLLQADGHTREYCKLEKAAGRISGDFVTLYPPGIPILAPGELAEEQILERINRYVREGLEVDGVRNGRILVWKERKDG